MAYTRQILRVVHKYGLAAPCPVTIGTVPVPDPLTHLAAARARCGWRLPLTDSDVLERTFLSMRWPFPGVMAHLLGSAAPTSPRQAA